MLRCTECDCISVEGRGWVAFLAEDPDDVTAHAEALVYCPVCAHEEFDREQRLAYR